MLLFLLNDYFLIYYDLCLSDLSRTCLFLLLKAPIDKCLKQHTG
jgi:hypothetical protein